MEDRRLPTRLHEDDRKAIDRIITLLDDENIGLCGTVKKHGEAIYGNGSLGIKTKITMLWIALLLLAVILGADHPIIKKLLEHAPIP